jgi:carbohydrate kinase (thermoresistant glucokinase family)
LASEAGVFEIVKPFGTVVDCSALKRAYRDLIIKGAPQTVFIELQGTRELLANRLESREGDFMKGNMLDSPKATPEPLGQDEPGKVIGIALPVEAIVQKALAEI